MKLLSIGITLNRWYKLQGKDETVDHLDEPRTRQLVQHDFASELSSLLIQKAEVLNLDPVTFGSTVEITNRQYRRRDLNIPNLRIKFRFSGNPPDSEVRHHIRNRLYLAVYDWFMGRGFRVENMIVEASWNPSNGKGMVDGVGIQW